jgi:hypothetical protein
VRTNTEGKVHGKSYISCQRSVSSNSSHIPALSSYPHFAIQHLQVSSISRHSFTMKSFAAAFLLAALASTVVGENCRPGLNYCGSSLLTRGKYSSLAFNFRTYWCLFLSRQVPGPNRPSHARRPERRPGKQRKRRVVQLHRRHQWGDSLPADLFQWL